MTGNTTIRYLALDLAGNQEAAKEASYVIALPVNGVCGSSNGGTFPTAPVTALCLTGTASAVSDVGSWSWSCQGLNSGTDASCSAAKGSVALKAGDCDGNGTVSIAEVQNAINMYLGMTAAASCVDSDLGGNVSISEVQKAINGYLGL